MKKIAILTGLIFPMLSVSAQIDTGFGQPLTEVVVTGQYKPQSVKNSVYQVRIIPRDQIQKQSGSKLQDVLSNQLNIRFSQDPATGGSNINMLGLPGQNVKILIDGVPMVGRQGTTNEININQIELNSIERIEVVEGPMSVIYGADALAGVINIITRKPSNKKYSINAKVQEGSIGKEYGIDRGIHNQFVGASGSYKNWYASGGIGRNLFSGWKDTAAGRKLLWLKNDQIVGNGMVGYRSHNLNVYYRFDGLDEIITNPGNFSGDQPALDQEYITDRLMQQLQASYIINPAITANAVASYTHFTRQVYSTLYYPNGDVRVSTAPGTQSVSTFNGYTIRGNVVYNISSSLSLQPGIDVNVETGNGERIKSGDQRINDYAFFITSEIKPTHALNVRPGLRFIKNSVYDAPPVIPSLNLIYHISPQVDFRFAYAKGFRAPSLRELYFDFHDGSHDIKGNTNLKAESSNSFTGSLSWNIVQSESTRLSATVSGFYNDVDNMIGYIQSAEDIRVTTYGNIDKFKTRGISLTGEFKEGRLKLNAGISYTGRYNQYRAEDASLAVFKWSPEANAVLGYNIPRIAMDINLYYKYTGKLPYFQLAGENGSQKVELFETEAYHWADITVNKKIFNLLTINAGIRNLFNVGYINTNNASSGIHSSGSVSPVGYGRSWFAGLSFNWDKK